jgi:ketosteroid isomerase-like protein
MRASAEVLNWLRAYYEAMDQRRFDEVAALLHEDCEAQFPAGIVVRGRERIVRGMRAGLEALAGIRHELKDAWQEDRELIFELEVTYHRTDGQTIVRPGVGIFVLDGGTILAQRLFVDTSGVWD